MSENWKKRMYLLSEDERKDLEFLVERKVEEKQNRALTWEPEEKDR